LRNADGSARQVNVPNLEVYDPARDRWETRAPMLQEGGLAAAVHGKLSVFGGEQWVPEQKVFGESWVYDPKTDTWEALPPLPTRGTDWRRQPWEIGFLCLAALPGRGKHGYRSPRSAGVAEVAELVRSLFLSSRHLTLIRNS